MYESRYETSKSYIFFQMWRQEEFLALLNGKRHCPAPPGSSVLQSHALSTAAMQNDVCCGRTYEYWIESGEWVSYCERLQSDGDWKTSEKRVWYGWHRRSDTGPVVSRAVKKALATGLASADQRQRQRRPETRLMSRDSGWLQHYKGRQQGLENRRLRPSPETWLQKRLCKVGAENTHRRTQNSAKEHMCGTSTAHWERRRCLCQE